MGVYAMTGGATGIGAAIKTQLRDAGHTVIVVDIKAADVEANLATTEGRRAAIDGIRERAGDGLDGFIPCAGVGPDTTPLSLVPQVNYFGAVALIEGLKDLVAKRRGTMVLISSNSAPMPVDEAYVDLLLDDDEPAACAHIETLDGHHAYAGSKQALTRWMRRRVVGYAGDGVRLNAVAPGITRTPLTDRVFEDPQWGPIMKDFGEAVPVGQMGRPEQIANVVTFLLSPPADFVCGAVVFVDGGHDAMLRPDQF